MLKSILLPFLLGFLVILVGCSTDPIVKYKYNIIAPPDNLLMDCPVLPPPERETYLHANVEGKEKLLFDLSSQQIKNLYICNVRLSELRAWKQKQEMLYADKQSPTVIP